MVAKEEKRVWGLDVLRSAAVLMVVLYHYPRSPDQLWIRALTHYGWAGVDLFFVLSGYLIGAQVFKAQKKNGVISFKKFYYRRFFRTLPNYYFVLLVFIVFIGGTDWRYLFFIQNFNSLPKFSQSWSLCVEEQFYLFFPLCVEGVRRRILNPIGLVVLFFGIGVLLRAWLWSHYRADLIYLKDVDAAFGVYLKYLFYPTYARLDGLVVGVSIAAVQVFRPILWKKILDHTGFFAGAGFFILGFAFFILRHQMSWGSSVFGFPLLGLGFGSFLISAVADRSLLNRVRIPGCEKLALLSYSIYLTHGLAIEGSAWVLKKAGLPFFGAIQFLCTFFLVGLLSWILYEGIERPFLKVRDRLV